MDSVYETLQLRGTLEGHNGWVTSLASSAANPDLLVSGSRDKNVIVWRLTLEQESAGYAHRSFQGHNHIVQDVVVSRDGEYVLSASWDKSMRLWSLANGTSIRFDGHQGDVMSCDVSPDNRLIASASRDKSVKIWNVVGQELVTLEGHSDWVVSAKFTPSQSPRLVTASHDKLVKTWDVATSQLAADFVGHKNYINTAILSPDGTICASGGKEGTIYIWSIETNSFNYTLPDTDEVFALSFAPTRYWIAAATSAGIKIYDLRTRALRETLNVEEFTGKEPTPISLTWSSDGQILFAGYTDHTIRVWQVMTTQRGIVA